jgi:hypothetical protein
MRDVTVSYNVATNCGGVTCALDVASNEPVNGDGDGNTAPDWQVVDDHHVRLRSERAGGGTGRIYTITITCTDSAGGSSSAETSVTVAHDQGGRVAASSGFNARGTGFDPAAETFRLIVFSGRAFHASKMDARRVVLGNRAGTVPVAEMKIEDADCDGRLDAVLGFSADAARELLRSRRGGGGGTLSFRYRGAGGRPIAVADIFALGPPVPSRSCPGGGRGPR